MKRRDFLKSTTIGLASISVPYFNILCSESRKKPNVVFILADDLGYGEVGCYGQTKIKTPNVDSLAAGGMKFTQHYSGSPVCAPSRCTLLTGKHTGRAYIRDNDELPERGDVWHDPELEGQRPLLPEAYTTGEMFQNAGYVTGAMGKWGLGGPGSTGEPNKQGFDHWFGYLCQREAHNYYPTYLWRNGEKVILKGNKYFFPHQRLPKDADPYDKSYYNKYKGEEYSHDLIVEEALWFIKKNRKNPFFLYLPFTIPHAAIQVPEDSLQQYEGKFGDTPYKGEKGYLPHPAPRAGYAAMITRMDDGIGRIVNLLKKLGLYKNTLIIFTSDNGPTFNGGTDSEFFNSTGPLRGLKTTLYEGGIRVPMIAHWKDRIKPGSVSSHISAFWDYMPTFADLIDTEIPVKSDGISMIPELLGKKPKKKKHDYLYWEYKGKQAVRKGKWKGLYFTKKNKFELYNLKNDTGERNNISEKHPEVTAEIKKIMEEARTKSELFPL